MLSSLDHSRRNVLQQLTGLKIYKYIASKTWFHFMKFRKHADFCSKRADIGFVLLLEPLQDNRNTTGTQSFLMGPASKHPSNSWNASGVTTPLGTLLPALCDDVFMLLEGKTLFLKVRGNFRRRAAYVSCHFPRLKVLTGASVWSCVGQPPPPPP